LSVEKDERYHYLIKNGNVALVENETNTIFVQLPQIPGVTVAYRRPIERAKCPKMFNLNNKKLMTVPLFEGEELLEELYLSKNLIMKLENLVSLPKLISLDLSHNKLSQITNMNTLQSLKTLNLSHNCIPVIEGLDYLKSLEILNLDANLISKIGSAFSHLPKLNTLYLSENSLEILDGIEVASNLKEIHIRKNKLYDITKILTLYKLEIVDFSENKIMNLSKEIASKCKNLHKFNIKGNPCENCPEFEKLEKDIKKRTSLLNENNNKIPASPFKNLNDALNYAKNVEIQDKPITVPIPVKTEMPQNTNNMASSLNISSNYTEEQKDMISQIRKEWKSECKNQVKNNIEPPKLFLSILENKTTLHLFGASSLDTLTTPEYENTVTEISLECIKFEHIVYPPVMMELRKYKLLNSLSLINNNLNSFVLLSKLEGLDKIKKLTILENPICNLVTLNAFISYRFQHVTEMNGKILGENDRKIAKQVFERFDKSLATATLANKKHLAYKKLGCTKSVIKTIAKEYENASSKFFQKEASESIEGVEKREKVDLTLKNYVADFVYEYTGKLEEISATGNTEEEF